MILVNFIVVKSFEVANRRSWGTRLGNLYIRTVAVTKVNVNVVFYNFYSTQVLNFSTHSNLISCI